MSTPNGDRPELAPEQDDLFEEVMGLAPRLRSQLLELEDQRTKIKIEQQRERERLDAAFQERYALIDQKKKRYTGLLRGLGEEPPAPKAARRQHSRSVSSNVSDRVMLQVVNEILTLDDDETFDALTLHGRVGARWSQPHTYVALKWLSEHEILRYIGKRQVGNASRNHYRMWDRQTIERFKTRLEEKVSPADDNNEANDDPSPDQVRQTIEAIRALDKPEFTILEINDQLGRSSPKRTYTTFRYFRSLGVVSEVGKTTPSGEGDRPRSLYTLANLEPLSGVLEPEVISG